jgi:hypothetical protein
MNFNVDSNRAIGVQHDPLFEDGLNLWVKKLFDG